MKITIDIDESEYQILINSINIHRSYALEAHAFSSTIMRTDSINIENALLAIADKAFSVREKIKKSWKGAE